jgi:hypothetical protein
MFYALIVAMAAPNTCLPLPRSALGFKATGGIGVGVFMQLVSVYYAAMFDGVGAWRKPVYLSSTLSGSTRDEDIPMEHDYTLHCSCVGSASVPGILSSPVEYLV